MSHSNKHFLPMKSFLFRGLHAKFEIIFNIVVVEVILTPRKQVQPNQLLRDRNKMCNFDRSVLFLSVRMCVTICKSRSKGIPLKIASFISTARVLLFLAHHTITNDFNRNAL